MEIREITDSQYQTKWNELAGHPLQSWEWGEFRAKTGIQVARWGLFDKGNLAVPIQVTIHPLPRLPWNIGYLPKGPMITQELTEALKQIAAKYNCLMIKCEPKIESQDARKGWQDRQPYVSGRPLFTKYNFVLDVTKSEDELLSGMKQKTRYNIRLAEKRGVTVQLDDSPQALARYLQLTEETTQRQGFYAHQADYHRKMWETLNPAGIAHLLTAKYKNEIITTWILFRFGDSLYYPYGASTREHREVMANNLVMWEAIRTTKKWKLKSLDMWGALGPDADPNDPWYGFHTFKSGYGARQVEYMGTWDYVANPTLYRLYTWAESLRWMWLRRAKKGS